MSGPGLQKGAVVPGRFIAFSLGEKAAMDNVRPLPEESSDE